MLVMAMSARYRRNAMHLPREAQTSPKYTTDKDVLVFGLFFGHGVFCTIDERKVQKEYHTSPRGADIPQCVVFTASGGR